MYLNLGKGKILARFYVKRYLARCGIFIYLKILTFANKSVEKTSLGIKQGEKLGVKLAQNFYTKRYYYTLYYI